MRSRSCTLAVVTVMVALAVCCSADAAAKRRLCGTVQGREVWVVKGLGCKTARATVAAVLKRGRAVGWSCGRYETGERFCSRGSNRPSYQRAELLISEPAESE